MFKIGGIGRKIALAGSIASGTAIIGPDLISSFDSKVREARNIVHQCRSLGIDCDRAPNHIIELASEERMQQLEVGRVNNYFSSEIKLINDALEEALQLSGKYTVEYGTHENGYINESYSANHRHYVLTERAGKGEGVRFPFCTK